MSDSQGGSPIQVAIVVLALVGGGWYFLRNYDIDGLDGVSVTAKDERGSGDSFGFDSSFRSGSFFGSGDSDESDNFVSFVGPPAIGSSGAIGSSAIGSSSTIGTNRSIPPENPFAISPIAKPDVYAGTRPSQSRPLANIRIGSWALDGFGPTKLSSGPARKYVTQVIRRFDVIALQQVASIERDLIPRLVELVNAGQAGAAGVPRYDYVISESTGPTGRQEQLAFVFDTTKVLVDRRQTYMIEDPSGEMTYDPLVASFRAAKPPAEQAWTFSLVNVRVDLARAQTEVALLPAIMKSVRSDGRGEDDVVVVGLFQADDAYLIPTMGGGAIRTAVASRSTDVFGRYQTSNVIIDTVPGREYLGRGGVFDYSSAFDLNPIQAEAVTSHLPVFAEFTAHEGGVL